MDKIKELINSILDLILPKEAGIIEIENMTEVDILGTTPQANEMTDTRYKALFQYKNT